MPSTGRARAVMTAAQQALGARAAAGVDVGDDALADQRSIGAFDYVADHLVAGHAGEAHVAARELQVGVANASRAYANERLAGCERRRLGLHRRRARWSQLRTSASIGRASVARRMLVFVVGTGTDVGKTHVTAALVAVSGAKAWKPVATGVTDAMGDDARAIGATEPPLYAFAPPISPHLAARAGRRDDHRASDRRARALARRAALRRERRRALQPDLGHRDEPRRRARARRDAMLLVAPDRLGVLHDVGATVRAATMPLPIVALSAPAGADASTGTNGAELVRLGLAQAVVEFPRGESRTTRRGDCGVELRTR